MSFSFPSDKQHCSFFCLERLIIAIRENHQKFNCLCIRSARKINFDHFGASAVFQLIKHRTLGGRQLWRSNFSFLYLQDLVDVHDWSHCSHVCIPNWNRHLSNRYLLMVACRDDEDRMMLKTKTMANLDHVRHVIYYRPNSKSHVKEENLMISIPNFSRHDWWTRPRNEKPIERSLNRRSSVFMNYWHWEYSPDYKHFLLTDDREFPRQISMEFLVCTEQSFVRHHWWPHVVWNLRLLEVWSNPFRNIWPRSLKHIHSTLVNIDWYHKDACHCEQVQRFEHGYYPVKDAHWRINLPIDLRLNDLEGDGNLRYFFFVLIRRWKNDKTLEQEFDRPSIDWSSTRIFLIKTTTMIRHADQFNCSSVLLYKQCSSSSN